MGLPRIVADGAQPNMVRRAFQDLDTKVVSRLQRRDLNVLISDYTGAAITTGIKEALRLASAARIVEWSLMGDQVGSIKIDLWKDALGNYPPTDADSICGGAEPQISNAYFAGPTAVSGWARISSGDVLMLNVDSCTAVRWANLHLVLELE